MPLDHSELHHLNAAVGWLELGNPAEAKAELSAIRDQNREEPAVLEVRWLMAAKENAWEEALRLARALVAAAPRSAAGWLHQAYSLRRAPGGSVKQAWDALLPAFDRFPKESTISYNLACYACQLGLLDAARVWFKRALVIGGKENIKRMALSDADLEPLWGEIRAM